MTIDEAIEILEGSYYKHTILLAGRDDEALKLGIEALKKLDDIRTCHPLFHNLLLPGETKD